MADPKFIPELDAVATFKNTDLIVLEVNPSGTPETVYMTIENWIAERMRRTEYQISRTFSSNNMIVAIKDPDGNDATADKPLYFTIDGTVRKLTGALSLQVNAGANVFNLGATEFAGSTQELFVYIGWRASTSSIFVLVSRIPYARDYSQFSGVSTNEAYGAYSGAAPAAADKVQVIGRVSVSNSGAALYNWSALSNVVLNYPIYRTSWMDWAPTPTGFSANPSGVVGRYKIDMNELTLFYRSSGSGTSNATTFTLSLPFTARTVANMVWGGSGPVFDNGVLQTSPGGLRVQSAAAVMEVFLNFGNAAFTNVGGKRLSQMNPMMYEIGA